MQGELTFSSERFAMRRRDEQCNDFKRRLDQIGRWVVRKQKQEDAMKREVFVKLGEVRWVL